MKTTANYATHPAPNRLESLRISVDSMLPQVDLVRIVWNDYKIVPNSFVHPRIVNVIPSFDTTDNGKFFHMTEQTREFYFTCDDDILYPPDYIEKAMPYITKGCGTFHGRILSANGAHSYYRGGHKAYSYLNSWDTSFVVEIGGTGVMGIDTRIFRPTEVVLSPHKCMSDLVLSIEAKRVGQPIVFIPHASGWLRHINTGQDTIANKFRKNESEQIQLLQYFY